MIKIDLVKQDGKIIKQVNFFKKDFPSPRYCHSSTYDSDNKILYIFGGCIEENPKLSNELWALNVNKNPTFSLIKNFKIKNRSNSIIFLDKRDLYIYGGYGISKVTEKIKILNDLKCYNLDLRKLYSNLSIHLKDLIIV